jgi:hypothetical protein
MRTFLASIVFIFLITPSWGLSIECSGNTTMHVVDYSGAVKTIQNDTGTNILRFDPPNKVSVFKMDGSIDEDETAYWDKLDIVVFDNHVIAKGIIKENTIKIHTNTLVDTSSIRATAIVESLVDDQNFVTIAHQYCKQIR